MVLMDLGFIPLITPVVILVIAAFLLKDLFWIWWRFFKMLYDHIVKRIRK